MLPMSEATSENGLTPAARMGKAIARGVVFGVPACLALITIGVWLITDLDIADSFAAAALPGVLLGGFAGGFAGMAMTME